MEPEDLYHHSDRPTPKKQILRDEPAERDLVDQYFVETLNVDDPFARLHDMHGENKRLQEQVFGYRAGFLMLLSLMVIWGVAIMVNRTPPLHLSACSALKYYLGALDEASSALPRETRQLLDTRAASCSDEDLDGFDNSNHG